MDMSKKNNFKIIRERIKTTVTWACILWLLFMLINHWYPRAVMHYELYHAKQSAIEQITTQFKTDDFILENSGYMSEGYKKGNEAEAFFTMKLQEKNYYISMKKQSKLWNIVSIENRSIEKTIENN